MTGAGPGPCESCRARPSAHVYEGEQVDRLDGRPFYTRNQHLHLCGECAEKVVAAMRAIIGVGDFQDPEENPADALLRAADVARREAMR